MIYLLHVLNMISIYSILALSLNLLVGYTGLLSLSHAAFYGIGAYITALLVVNFGVNFFAAMALGVAGAVCLSLFTSVPSLRLRGDYFVLASLGFQMIIFAVLYNWVGVTQGPFGVSGIPRPSVFGLRLNSVGSYLILNIVVAGLCAVLLYFLGGSPFGRVLKAIREDEVAVAALGKNVVRFKIVATAVAAGFAAVAGAIFAGYLRYIDPTSFTLTESVFILSIIIVGGAGNFKGPLLGTALMLLLPEALRLASIPDALAPNLRQVIYGLVIILLMQRRPQGLSGEYRYQ